MPSAAVWGRGVGFLASMSRVKSETFHIKSRVTGKTVGDGCLNWPWNFFSPMNLILLKKEVNGMHLISMCQGRAMPIKAPQLLSLSTDPMGSPTFSSTKSNAFDFLGLTGSLPQWGKTWFVLFCFVSFITSLSIVWINTKHLQLLCKQYMGDIFFHAYHMNRKLKVSLDTSYPKCMFRTNRVKDEPCHCKCTSSQKLGGLTWLVLTMEK